MTSTRASSILAVAIWALPAAGAVGQPAASPPLSIRVTEQATVTATPDEVQIDVGVTTQAERSRAAADRNAQQVSRVIVTLRKAIGPEATVETISYTLAPDYRHPRDGGEPTITGYTATNLVRITLHDLRRVGEVVDAATNAGANRIHRINFTLKNDEAARARALRAAAAKARVEAEALASALGVRVVRVWSATTGEPTVRPLHDVPFMRAEAAQAATPIHPGPLEIEATVTLTVEITDDGSSARLIR